MLNWGHIQTIESELDLENREVKAAWNGIKVALVTPYMGDAPPTPRGEERHGAVKLAQMSDKTGFEKLFFRYCGLQEAMLEVLTELLPPTHPLRAAQIERWEAQPRRSADVAEQIARTIEDDLPALMSDGVYQPSYCEDCGAELDLEGDCGNAGCDDGLAF